MGRGERERERQMTECTQQEDIIMKTHNTSFCQADHHRGAGGGGGGGGEGWFTVGLGWWCWWWWCR